LFEKQHKKERKMYRANEFGRSMVEMLGVLAIIGVLSVGAIAGYQKAMNKYRINKFLNDSAFVLRTILNDKDAAKDIGTKKEVTRNLVISYLKALNAVPTGWQIKNNLLYDTVGGYYDLFLAQDNMGGYSGNTFVVDYYYDHANEDLCVAWFMDLIRTIDNPYFFYLSNQSIVYYDRENCNGTGKKCISQATLADIKNYCSQCSKVTNCYLGTRFY
jgi:type II secretory pathway pseudopilin PulG